MNITDTVIVHEHCISSVAHICRYFTNFAGSLLIKGKLAGNPRRLQKNFPEFLWLLRDVDLDMVDEDGETELSPTEYVTKYVLQRDNSDDTGGKILDMFPNFTCLKITRPLHSAKELHEYDDEASEFNKDVQYAIDHIKAQVKAKKGFEGYGTVDGPSLAILAKQFVDVLNTPGSFPDIERGWNAVVEQQLNVTVDGCVEEYSKELSSKTRGKFPFEEDRLMKIHDNVLSSKLECLQNKARSLIRCQNILDTNASKLTERIVKYDTKSTQVVVGGELFQFVVENHRQSLTKCKSLSQELRNANLTLPQLIESYKRQAIGPAKDDVYQQDISVIPGKPEELLVQQKSHNMVNITWRQPTVHRGCEKKYRAEMCLDIQNDKWGQTETTHCQRLSVRFNQLKPFTNYRFRVCAINGNIKSEYSIIDLSTAAGPPNRPDTPNLEVTGLTRGILTCTAPKKGDGNGSPINKMIVKLYIEGDKVLQSVFKLSIVNAECIRQEVQLPTVENDETVYIRVLWENKVGISTESDPVLLPVADMIPGPPLNLRTVGRTNRKIKIRYDPPEINAGAVHTYVIKLQKKTDGFQLLTRTEKCSALAKKLKSNTKYTFKVEALNKNSQFCNDPVALSCETKLHPVSSGFAQAGGASVGAVASPITGAVLVPAVSALALKDGISEKSAGKIIGGTIGLLSTPITAPLGFLGGLLASPLGAAGVGMAAHEVLKDSDDDLEDSDDDVLNQ